MTLQEAILLGIIQGLTEFLPISSTAHLRIIPALAGWQDPGAAFTAVIQLGTLAAVLAYFTTDILRITRATLSGLAKGKPLATHDARLGWMIVVGTVPIVIFGLLFKDAVNSTLRSLYVISGSLIGLALLLAVAEWLVRRREKLAVQQKTIEDLNWADAIAVGFAQAVALIPGSSRSGVTITGGLFQGLTRETAARFSFLLSLPSVLAAAVFELVEFRHELLQSTADIQNLLAATVISAVIGYASIAFLLSYLKHRSTWIFIFYRLALGSVLLALLATGRLAPL